MSLKQVITVQWTIHTSFLPDFGFSDRFIRGIEIHAKTSLPKVWISLLLSLKMYPLHWIIYPVLEMLNLTLTNCFSPGSPRVSECWTNPGSYQIHYINKGVIILDRPIRTIPIALGCRSLWKDLISAPNISIWSTLNNIHRKAIGHFMKFVQRSISYCFHITLRRNF